jgi:hypothetical protein
MYPLPRVTPLELSRRKSGTEAPKTQRGNPGDKRQKTNTKGERGVTTSQAYNKETEAEHSGTASSDSEATAYTGSRGKEEGKAWRSNSASPWQGAERAHSPPPGPCSDGRGHRRQRRSRLFGRRSRTGGQASPSVSLQGGHASSTSTITSTSHRTSG